MFHFARCASAFRRIPWVRHGGFPHSEISGSQAAQRLPEAYRSHATSFIAIVCLGFLRAPFFPLSCAEILNNIRTACTVINLMQLITRKFSNCFQYLRLNEPARGASRSRNTPRRPIKLPEKPHIRKKNTAFRGVGGAYHLAHANSRSAKLLRYVYVYPFRVLRLAKPPKKVKPDAVDRSGPRPKRRGRLSLAVVEGLTEFVGFDGFAERRKSLCELCSVLC